MTVFRDNREPDPTRETNAQIATGPNEAPQPPVAQFSESNEKWLADSVNEIRQKDADYARLNSEQSREQWEKVARANLLRQKQHAEERQDAIAVGQMNRRVKDELDAQALLQQHAEIGATLPENWTENTLPLEKLRAVASITQKLGNVAERLGVKPAETQPQQQQHPETFPDGSLYQLNNLADGQIEVKLITGERFIGDPLTVTANIAEANVHTKRWAQQQRAQGQQVQQQQVQPSPQQPTTGNEVPQNTFGEWAADQQAQALGFANHNELVEWGIQTRQDLDQMKAVKEEWTNHQIASDFLSRCPDYPNTPEAEGAIVRVVEHLGLDYNPDTLAAAHAYAVRNGMYQPLTVEQQRAAMGIEHPQTRQAPPPMLQGRAPDSQQQHDNNGWTMPMAELRKAAIAQELGGQQ
jgi:hypothetical protein